MRRRAWASWALAAGLFTRSAAADVCVTTKDAAEYCGDLVEKVLGRGEVEEADLLDAGAGMFTLIDRRPGAQQRVVRRRDAAGQHQGVEVDVPRGAGVVTLDSGDPPARFELSAQTGAKLDELAQRLARCLRAP